MSLRMNENICFWDCLRFEYTFKIHWIPQRRKWLLTPVFLPREFHEQRSLVGYRPWGFKELDMTEQLIFFIFKMQSFIARNIQFISTHLHVKSLTFKVIAITCNFQLVISNIQLVTHKTSTYFQGIGSYNVDFTNWNVESKGKDYRLNSFRIVSEEHS